MLDIRVTGLRVQRRQLSGPMRLTLRPGDIHELSGPNGCGKSLLLDAVSGIGPARGVHVNLAGESLDRRWPAGRWQRGLRRMFQAPVVPGEVTVGAVMGTGHGTSASANLRAETMELLGSVGLRPDTVIARCSFGQRRLVEFCLSLLAPKVALLDEPFSGLSADLRVGAQSMLRRAAHAGLAALVVDHLRQEHGGTYGHEHAWVPPVTPLFPQNNALDALSALESHSFQWHEPAHTRWDVHSIGTPDRTVMASAVLDLPPGSAIVILGENGSGKSTVLRALGGLQHPWGDFATQASRVSRSDRAFVSPQPPKLVADLSVADNLRCMLWEPQHNGARSLDVAWSLLQWLGFAVNTRRNRLAGELSGGEAAMVALVGAIVCDTRLLLLDEPFEGLSADVLKRVLELIGRALRLKKSVILATHEFPSWVLIPSASTVRLNPSTAVTGTYSGGNLPTDPAQKGVS